MGEDDERAVIYIAERQGHDPDPCTSSSSKSFSRAINQWIIELIFSTAPPLIQPNEDEDKDSYVTAEEDNRISDSSLYASFTSNVNGGHLSTIYEEDLRDAGDMASSNAFELVRPK
ncbi:hypothetical protein NP233_g10795 [Leucocoprinus birnbaumii]|uniref:Uncharacterized protein n=1 Tax=Leucocoprinus birnbaumii TaxID=56174 RepID=A0AAD5YLU8_9AGAR|nr:hypothetical protein NP233_g10795 [Leucocoprinus birnbaumii]